MLISVCLDCKSMQGSIPNDCVIPGRRHFPPCVSGLPPFS